MCEEGHEQEIAHIEHINSASDCQAICQNHGECGFWSHYRQGEGHDHWGHCYLYYSCDRTTDHECFGPEDHECREVGPGPRHTLPRWAPTHGPRGTSATASRGGPRPT